MANIIECDGCGTRLNLYVEVTVGIEGRRIGPPDVTFHWCKHCAEIAREAVQAQALPSDVQAEEDKIRDMLTEAQEHPGRIVTR